MALVMNEPGPQVSMPQPLALEEDSVIDQVDGVASILSPPSPLQPPYPFHIAISSHGQWNVGPASPTPSVIVELVGCCADMTQPMAEQCGDV